MLESVSLSATENHYVLMMRHDRGEMFVQFDSGKLMVTLKNDLPNVQYVLNLFKN